MHVMHAVPAALEALSKLLGWPAGGRGDGQRAGSPALAGHCAQVLSLHACSGTLAGWVKHGVPGGLQAQPVRQLFVTHMLQKLVSVTDSKAPHVFLVQSLTLWLALPCRDLKPHNVLLTEGQRAKLSDMGLCKRLFAEQTSFESPGPGEDGMFVLCT